MLAVITTNLSNSPLPLASSPFDLPSFPTKHRKHPSTTSSTNQRVSAPTTATASSSSSSSLLLPQQSHSKQQQPFQPIQQRPSLYPSPHSKAQQSKTKTQTNNESPIPTATSNSERKIGNNKKKDNFILRSGKWTSEEESYATILIELFEAGEVDKYEYYNSDIEGGRQKQPKQQQHIQIKQHMHELLAKTKITNGTTLRSYLSRKLFCSPMRISKKFAGKGIGKRVYMSRNPSLMYNHRSSHPFISVDPVVQAGGITTATGISSYITTANSTTDTRNYATAIAVTSTLPCQHPPGHSLFPSSSSSSLPSSITNGKHWNKLNRLKRAESDFLEVAFPNGDPMGAYKRKKIHLALLKAASAPSNTSSINAAIAPSTITSMSKPSSELEGNQQRQHTVGNSSDVHLSPDAPGSEDNSRRYNNFPRKSWRHNPKPKQLEIIAKSPLLEGPVSLLPQAATDETPKQPSKIQKLKEAYFSSVSRRNQYTPSQDLSTINENSASLQHNSQLSINTKRTNAQMQKQQNPTETKRNNVLQNDSKGTDTVSNYINHSSEAIAKNRSFDTNLAKTVMSTTKLPTDVPNFLSGFDTIYRKQSDQNTIIANNVETVTTESDLYFSAQFSPAYHTSKSFDDFHRYLGKGLSPTVAAPPPIFPLLPQSIPRDHIKSSAPIIPMSNSSGGGHTSNLPLRPRGQQGAEKRNSANLKPSTPPVEGGNFRSNNDIEAFPYSVFAQKSSTASRQHSTYAKIKEPELHCQGQNKYDETEFPLELMTFEDFGTLETEITVSQSRRYANVDSDRSAMVSEPTSDCPSDDPNSGSGEGTSDESDNQGYDGDMF